MDGKEGYVPALLMEALNQVASAARGLELLMLYGSRARGDSHAQSDWDFAYLAKHNFDTAGFLGRLVEMVGSDRVDLADLRSASGLLRYRAARDGQLIFEARPRLGEEFRLEAAHFWCDAAYVLEQGYGQVLAELER